VCVHPSFTEPEAALRALGRPVERAFRDPSDWGLDPARVAREADMVVTGNPNNPTGGLDPAADVAALARPGRVLVVDEAFMDFVPGEPESVAGRDDVPGLVVVRSLTKLWGLAGVRAGYLLAPRPLAAALRRLRPAWNANVLALAAIRACSARSGEARAVAVRVGEAREALLGRLAALRGVETWPSAANFLLLRVPDGDGVRAGLLARGVAVRPCATFPGLTSDHLRVAVRSPDANARLVRALEEALG
jgi:histidinol-phosphate aminotransferase